MPSGSSAGAAALLRATQLLALNLLLVHSSHMPRRICGPLTLQRFHLVSVVFSLGVISPASAAAGDAGALDASFGQAGVAARHVSGERSCAYDLAPHPDGAFGGGGGRSRDSGDFLIMRYTSEGEPDPTFGDGGSVVIPVTTGD